jgi:hypothetical protein
VGLIEGSDQSIDAAQKSHRTTHAGNPFVPSSAHPRCRMPCFPNPRLPRKWARVMGRQAAPPASSASMRVFSGSSR